MTTLPDLNEIELPPLADALRNPPLGLYPLCEACGERIEADRLRADAAERYCWSCAHRHATQRGPQAA